jgi:hypothetical protein
MVSQLVSTSFPARVKEKGLQPSAANADRVTSLVVK